MSQFVPLTAVAVLCGMAVLPALAGSSPCGIWEVVAAPNPPQAEQSIIRDIVAISPGDVWAVGGYNKTVQGQVITYAFSMHWDGSTWTDVPTPQPSACPSCTNVTLWGVDANGPDDVWACGHKNVQAADGFLGTHILVMHWDGSSWTVMNTPIQNGASGDLLWAVEAIAPDDVWFFGENIYQGPSSPDLAIALHWNGSNFEFKPVPSVNPQTSGFGDGNGLRAGSALSPTDIWAVGAASDGDSMPSAHSQIQHWNGASWTPIQAQNMPGFYHDLEAVVAIAPNDVWAGGSYFDGEYHGLALHWDGNTWTQVPIPGGVMDFVAFASNDVYAAGAGIMHWDGVSWTVVESFPQVNSPSFAGLSAAGPCELWAGGRQFLDGTLLNLTTHLQPSPPSVALGDANHDGSVDIDDLLMVINAWGSCPAPPVACDADMNASGTVDIDDLLTVINHWE
jgi:hypothetical protein